MHRALTGKASSVGGAIWLVDWSGSVRARKLLRFALQLEAVRRVAPTEIVIAAPGGDSSELSQILPMVPHRSIYEVVTAENRREADARVLLLSKRLIPFDRAQTLELGDRLLLFNAMDLQDSLRRFEVMAALCRQAATAGRELVRCYTLDLALAEALAIDAPQYGVSVRASRLLARLARTAGGVTPSRPAPKSPATSVAAPAVEPASALLVSWTRPMDVMMAAVQEAASRRGLSDVLHLHHAAESVSAHARCEPLASTELRSVRVLRDALWTAAVPRLPGGGAGIVLRAALSDAEVNLSEQEAHHSAAVRWIRTAPPSVIVVGSDRWWIGSAWVIAARSMGIPTLSVQDGIADDRPQWRWLTADRVATNGLHLKRLLTEAGYSPERIIVTGQPRYDETLRRDTARNFEHWPERLSLPSNKRVVLFATQYGQDANFVRKVVRAILQEPRLFLVLRPHPSEDHSTHQQLAAATPRQRMVLAADVPIDILLALSDIVVMQSSSVALEADILGRRLVLVDFSGTPTLDSLSKLRAHRATNEDSLRRHLAFLAAEPDIHPLPPPHDEEFIGPLDGRSSDRVAAAIQVLLSRAAKIA